MNNDNNKKADIFKKPVVQSASIMVVVFGLLGGFMYLLSIRNVVEIENSVIDAPISNVSPTTPGILNAIYVKDGDIVEVNNPIALVGSENIFAKEAGIITNAPKVVGSYYAPNQKIASIIANKKMRIIGSIEETKGLAKIKKGQKVKFTVDAFDGKKYEAVVDGVSEASADTGIIFSISDKRPVKKFNVYMNFDISKYPELKTGMSAKTFVYTK